MVERVHGGLEPLAGPAGLALDAGEPDRGLPPVADVRSDRDPAHGPAVVARERPQVDVEPDVAAVGVATRDLDPQPRARRHRLPERPHQVPVDVGRGEGREPTAQHVVRPEAEQTGHALVDPLDPEIGVGHHHAIGGRAGDRAEPFEPAPALALLCDVPDCAVDALHPTVAGLGRAGDVHPSPPAPGVAKRRLEIEGPAMRLEGREGFRHPHATLLRVEREPLLARQQGGVAPEEPARHGREDGGSAAHLGLPRARPGHPLDRVPMAPLARDVAQADVSTAPRGTGRAPQHLARRTARMAQRGHDRPALRVGDGREQGGAIVPRGQLRDRDALERRGVGAEQRVERGVRAPHASRAVERQCGLGGGVEERAWIGLGHHAVASANDLVSPMRD